MNLIWKMDDFVIRRVTKLKAKIPHNSWQFSNQEEQTFPLCKFLLIPSWQKVGVTLFKLYEAIPMLIFYPRKTHKSSSVLHFPKWLYNWLVRTSNLFTTAPLNSSTTGLTDCCRIFRSKTIIHERQFPIQTKSELESVSNSYKNDDDLKFSSKI